MRIEQFDADYLPLLEPVITAQRVRAEATDPRLPHLPDLGSTVSWLAERMDVLGGNFIHDPIGAGYDLIWASNSLNGGKDDMGPLMKKIYDALNPGGVFIVAHEGLTHEQTRPEIMMLSWIPMMLMGQDMSLDQGFIADAMLRVGFKSVCSRTLNTDWGPVDLDIGRKA